MFNERFFKKKQLLAARDAVLEEIGEYLFKRGDLPPDFRHLPNEFKNMDTLVVQLEDRVRVLKEERDRVHYDFVKLQNHLSDLEGALHKRHQPLRHEYDELMIRIQHQRDKAEKKTKTRRLTRKLEDTKPWEDRCRKLAREMNETRAKKEEAEAALRDLMDPLDNKLRKLTQAMRRVEDEGERLRFDRRRHLRDLGYWCYNQRPDEPDLVECFGRLDLLRGELADTRKESHPLEEPTQPVEPQTGNWGWLVALTLIAIFIGYVFRTQFREEDVSLSAVAASFMKDRVQFLLFADLTRINPARVADELPKPGDLPGGAAFRDMKPGDLNAFLLGRGSSGSGKLLFCGLKFRNEPTRVNLRLTQQGWRYRQTKMGAQALADPNDEWAWIILNSREFFLLPTQRLLEFERLISQSAARPESLYLERHLEPFDNNKPLLQGFNHMALVQVQNEYKITLRSGAALPDLQTRIDWLKATDAFPRISFQNESLVFKGESAKFTPISYREEHMRRFLLEQVAPLSPLRQPTTPPLQAAPVPLEGSHEQQLMVFRNTPAGLELLDEINAGHRIEGLTFLKKEPALLAADAGGNAVLKYQLHDERLHFVKHQRYQPGEPFAGAADANLSVTIAPSRIVTTPDEAFAVVLETQPQQTGRPRLLLIRTDDLQPFWVEEPPKTVRRTLSADWSSDGAVLYVGCETSGRGGSNDLAVLVYRRVSGMLQLNRLIDLPNPDRGPMLIPSLRVHQTHQALYMLQQPLTRLVRFELEAAESPFPETLDLTRAALSEGFENNSFQLNRTGDLALITETVSPESGLLYLVDLNAATLTLLDRLDLELKPSNALRMPLSDKFWVTGPDQNMITGVKIERNSIDVLHTTRLETVSPRHLATDQWGRYLFVAGRLYQPTLKQSRATAANP